MPIDQDSWRHHQAAAAELLGRRAEAWPERPPELVAASKEHTGALAQLIVDEAEQAVDPADLSTVTTLLDTDNPIFICGVMKSGTTLLLNLLDAHPAVAALPGDSFLRDAIAQPFSTESIKTHLEHWVRRMMNPSGQHPFFVLGAGPDRYVRFVRVMRAAMDDSSHRIASHRIASHRSRLPRGSLTR